MIETRNKKSIKNLSFKSLKANKSRNIFAIIAIALTTILFTTCFTIGTSMIKSLQLSTMRQVGTSAHGSFKYLTLEELNNIKDHKLIKDFGYSVFLSIAENKELLKRQTEMRYATNKTAEFGFHLPTTGKMPEKENEIATDTIVLDKLGIPHKIGEKLTLSYCINDKKFTDTFVISGYWEGDIVNSASMIWVSKKFMKTSLENINPKYTKEEMLQNGFYSGFIFADVMFSNSFNIEDKLLKILDDNGYKEKDIPVGVNWAYASTNFTLNLGTMLSLIGALILIALSGYLIIYNIFYISVAKDTKFYGMLKTIGTTPKQIKIIVKKQARILSIVGIPIGLIIGYVVGSILTPFALQNLNITHHTIAFNPVIFIGAALFSLITVSISCRKPAKVASKISAIEAMHYTDVSYSNKKKVRKSSDGGKIYKMALSNILRNTKKTIVVVTSLSLSIILLTSVYTIVKGFDMDKYINNMITSDFTISNISFFNNYIEHKNPDILTEEIIHEIGCWKGIENIDKVYFQECTHKLTNKSLKWLENSLKNVSNSSNTHWPEWYITEAKEGLKKGELKIHLNGLDKLIWSKFDIDNGHFDAEKFATGNYVILGKPNFPLSTPETYYKIGETFKMTYDNGIQKNYEVMAIGEVPHSLTVKHIHGNGMEVYLPADEFKVHIENSTIMTAILDVEDQYIDSVETHLSDYVKTKHPMLNYKSRKVFEEKFAKTQSTYTTVGYSLSFIIALIGIFNFINSMATNIISRRQEYAMLQSIGMTDKQLYKMIIFEGLYYALFTILSVITLGTALSYLIVKVIAGSIWFFTYHFTLLPVLICAPFLAVISVIVPIICYKTTSNVSIVERLRKVE